MTSKRGKTCFETHVKGCYFETSKAVEKLIEETEGEINIDSIVLSFQKFVTNTLEKGDRNKAMQKLRVPPLSGLELKKHTTTFKSGLMTGLSIAILIAAILSSVLKRKLDMGESEMESDDLPALVTFRCTFLLFFYAILTSWDTYGYRYCSSSNSEFRN
eukprot:sb/3472986/